jgi:BirA family biotin operon repressor/biotin-[acetyl-CoA-carboxylase] ligase
MIGYKENIIRPGSVNSTNEYALELFRNNKITNDGTIVVTHNQTKGKGLDNNSWESEPGKNLTFSVCLFPHFLPVERQFELNKAMSLGIYDFVRDRVPNEKITIKWPNDIYINNEKVAGILINNTIKGNILDFTVAGFGININQAKFISDAPNPVSFIKYRDKKSTLDECLNLVCKKLDTRYEQLKANQFAQLDSDYLESLYRFNENHTFKYEGIIIDARITGISNFGHLQLDTKDGRKLECDLKDIAFII